MNITEILTQAQQSSDAVTDLLIELAQQNKEVTATAQHMCDLYFADVRLREKGIRDKVAALEKQMTELDAQIRGMQAAVVDAAGTGDADTFAQEQDKLAKIEARKAAISTQIEMLRAAHVRGSEELYGLPFPVIVAGHQNTAFRTHRRVFVPHHINTLANV